MVERCRLLELLAYSPETGVFTWRKTRNGFVKAGSVAGSHGGKGYIYISIDGKKYFAHRLAWLYCHGVFPSAEIDHINRIKDDNRMSNLREADRFVNNQNASMRADNTSGVVGVDWYKKKQKWRARIMVNKKSILLGFFSSVEDAANARRLAKSEHHDNQLKGGT